MKKNLSGTSDKAFLGDLYCLLQKYYYAEDTDEYWAGLLEDSNKILFKCGDSEKAKLYKTMLTDFYKFQSQNSCHK